MATQGFGRSAFSEPGRNFRFPASQCGCQAYQFGKEESTSANVSGIFAVRATGSISNNARWNDQRVYTAHSHPYMQQFFASQEAYIWPDVLGESRGQSIAPLYKEVVKAALQDPELYKMLALLDVIRVGRTRELKVALEELKKMIQ